jgi:hypothetical protein
MALVQKLKQRIYACFAKSNSPIFNMHKNQQKKKKNQSKEDLLMSNMGFCGKLNSILTTHNCKPNPVS